MDDITIDARKQELLEARFLGIPKVQSGSESNMSTGSSTGAGASLHSDKEVDSISGYPSTPENAERQERRKNKKRKANENYETGTKKSGGNSTVKKINEYFEPASPSRNYPSNEKQLTSPNYANTIRSSPSSRHSNSSNHIDYSGLIHLQHKHSMQKEAKTTQTDMSSQHISQLEDANSGQQSEKNKKLNELQRQKLDMEYHLNEYNGLATKYKAQLYRCLQVCQELLIEKAKTEKTAARRKAMEGRLRLGQFSRQGTGYQETWTNGWAFTELGQRKERINKEKEDIEKARKMLNKRKPSAAIARNKGNQGDGGDGSFVKPKEPKETFSPQEYHERDEVLRQRLSAAKRDEVDLQFELERLERERSLHIRELKRIGNEDNSRFNDHPVLNKRYLLLSLLGKGGFSEVYKGFDLEEQRYVAVKIHHLNREWNEQKKLDYARHANREADIHRRVNHQRIVSLYDRFEVDINTFCTVLEFCGGNDLDFYLKQHKLMGEKEARTIIMQVVSALIYLNSLERPVIHYDLKPGNILLCNGTVCGDIKITDFGLSKQFDEGLSSHDGMDLTSQGAGTYWYLPPECFIRGPGGQPPKIDNKVDVWSVGVIFYQCLYGKKPFGHNLTQEAILKQNTILRATEVSFPTKPAISPEAKSFIRQCLMYHKEQRAGVAKLAEHPYLKPPANKRGASNVNQNGSNAFV